MVFVPHSVLSYARSTAKGETYRRHWLPAEEAARLVGYRLEYVTSLATAGTIVATQHNGQWYVVPASLKYFSLKQAKLTNKRPEAVPLAQWRTYAQTTLDALDSKHHAQQTTAKVWAGAVAVATTACALLTLWFGGLVMVS